MKKNSFITVILGISFFALLINPSVSFAQNSEVNTENSTTELQKIKNDAFQQLLELLTYDKLSADNFHSTMVNIEKSASEKEVYLVLISTKGTNEYNKLFTAKNNAFQQFLTYSTSDKLNPKDFDTLIGKLQLSTSEEEVNSVISLSEKLLQIEQDLKTAKNNCVQKAFDLNLQGKISAEKFKSILDNLIKVSSIEEVNEILMELK